MRFIDLFAGLGGFHKGIMNAGHHECVFACEIDETLQQLYEQNYGIKPMGDITTIDESKIPKHDLLCAGFPCQSFSLAGKKDGENCPVYGRLINHVMRILSYHKPRIVILENVPNLLKIDDGRTWARIEHFFAGIGYSLTYKVISPVEFGIPQNRKRLFAIGFRNKKDADMFQWPELEGGSPTTLSDLLDDSAEHRKLEPRKQRQLNHWQRLLRHLGVENLKAKSILAQEFGATYPENFTGLSLSQMQKFKGAYGKNLKKCRSWGEIMEFLPSYVRNSTKIPDWLEPSVAYSRSIYSANKKYIDDWKLGVDKENNSWQALEWRGYSDNVNFKRHLIQFRPSGIRISKGDIAPSLTSMTPTQIPIIGDGMRYLSKKEAAKLQNLHTLKKVPKGNAQAFKALGNSVNARIIELIICNVL